jgi:hypothetical protein
VSAAQPAKGDSIMTSNTEKNKPKPRPPPKPDSRWPPKRPPLRHRRALLRRQGKDDQKGRPSRGEEARQLPGGGKKAKVVHQGSKTATILHVLRRPDGATGADLMKATGWQAHYADVRIMPTCVGNPVVGRGSLRWSRHN